MCAHLLQQLALSFLQLPRSLLYPLLQFLSVLQRQAGGSQLACSAALSLQKLELQQELLWECNSMFVCGEGWGTGRWRQSSTNYFGCRRCGIKEVRKCVEHYSFKARTVAHISIGDVMGVGLGKCS